MSTELPEPKWMLHGMDVWTESQVREAIAADRQRIVGLLKGIDRDESNIADDDGWWETSTGAKFGARVLKAILDGSSEVPKE
jgi:hypothetical protein